MPRTKKQTVTLAPGAAWVLVQLTPAPTEGDPDNGNLTVAGGNAAGAIDAVGVARILAAALPLATETAIAHALTVGQADAQATNTEPPAGA